MQYISHLKDKGLLQRSIDHELHAINHYYKFLQQQGLVRDNPVPFIKIQGIIKQTLHAILKKEQLEEIYKSYRLSEEAGIRRLPIQELRHKRNKVMLGFMLFQGMTITDLELLDIQDVKLTEGKIYIPGSKMYAARELPLEAAQIVSLIEYVQVTRKELIQYSNKHTTKLIISSGKSIKLTNTLTELMEQVRIRNDFVVNAKQIRASVIVHWLQEHGLRKAQYKAGHKYISATEAYKVYITGELAENIEQFHPLSNKK